MKLCQLFLVSILLTACHACNGGYPLNSHWDFSGIFPNYGPTESLRTSPRPVYFPVPTTLQRPQATITTQETFPSTVPTNVTDFEPTPSFSTFSNEEISEEPISTQKLQTTTSTQHTTLPVVSSTITNFRSTTTLSTSPIPGITSAFTNSPKPPSAGINPLPNPQLPSGSSNLGSLLGGASSIVGSLPSQLPGSQIENPSSVTHNRCKRSLTGFEEIFFRKAFAVLNKLGSGLENQEGSFTIKFNELWEAARRNTPIRNGKPVSIQIKDWSGLGLGEKYFQVISKITDFLKEALQNSDENIKQLAKESVALISRIVQKRVDEMEEYEMRRPGNVRNDGHIHAEEFWQRQYDSLRKDAGLDAFEPVTTKPRPDKLGTQNGKKPGNHGQKKPWRRPPGC